MPEGGSVTLVGPGAVIVADASLDDGLRDLLTAAVVVDDCLGAIVAALSAHVRRLPSLVCAIRESDGLRLLLRGTAEAVVTTASGEQRIAPGAVSTWAEHMLPDAASLVLRHGPGGSPVILPGSLTAGLATPGAATAPVPTPADVPAPEDLPSLSSSTLAWTGDAVVAAAARDGMSGLGDPAADEAAAEPLPPSADSPGEPSEDGNAPVEEPEPVVPADEADDDPFGFRHLLDETMHVSTEEAAVRPPPEDEDEVPAAEPVPTAPEPVPADPEPEPPAPVSLLPVMTGGGLIDSVPGALRVEPPAPPVAAPPTPVLAPVPGGNGRVGGAAPGGVPAVPAGGAGAPFAGAAARPPVQAVLCEVNHPNPVIASECRICRRPLRDRTPHTVPRPSLGRLVFTDGMVTELDGPVLIGRAPAESMAAPDLRETPKLLSLPSQDKRISRLHAEIRLEGWQVYVLDSSSLNGTTVMQPGLPPRQLRSGEPCLVEPGSSVNLGGAVTFTFEGPS